MTDHPDPSTNTTEPSAPVREFLGSGGRGGDGGTWHLNPGPPMTPTEAKALEQ